jgi:hypothetical protein
VAVRSLDLVCIGRATIRVALGTRVDLRLSSNATRLCDGDPESGSTASGALDKGNAGHSFFLSSRLERRNALFHFGRTGDAAHA